MKKLVVLEPLGVNEEDLLKWIFESLGDEVEVTLYSERAVTDDQMIERAKDANYVVIANQPMSEYVLEGLKNIELLAVAFTGFDHIPILKCKERGITVCNASGYSNQAVCDLVFGMAIALLRNLRECDNVVRQGGTLQGLVGQELSALTFGVIGTGAIGSQVIKVAQAFGAKVVAYNRSVKPLENVDFLPLHEVMEKSDIISLHLPINETTKGIIGREEINLMKKNAILINCGRGPLVDIDALADALHQNLIGGAAIDVFYTEPPLEENHPLFTTPNTLLTPHVAFATNEAFVKRAHIVIDNIKAYINKQPVNVVS